MKSIVSGLVATSVLFAPVSAMARDRDDYSRGEYHEHHGIGTGGAIALGLGALILGAAAASNHPRYDRGYDRGYDPNYDRRYYNDRDAYYDRGQNCYQTVVTRYDYYGRPWQRVETRCF